MTDNKIIQFSTGRSGSTLMWQILKLIFKDKEIIKSHEKEFIETYQRWNCPMVLTKRDPRDTIISFLKVEKYPSDPNALLKDINRDMIRGFVPRIKTKQSILRNVIDIYQGPVLVLEYEKFYNNYDYTFSKLESFFGTMINFGLREQVILETSLQKNIDRQSEFSSFANHCPESNIHGHHITFPEPGNYKKILSTDDQVWLSDVFKDEIEFWRNFET